MTDPNVVGQMVAYGELELTPAALRQPAEDPETDDDE